MKDLLLNLPEPLRGSETGSFTEYTLNKRLPEIGQRLLSETNWPSDARRRLEALVAGMPHDRLRPLEDPGALDERLWLEWMAPFLGQTWLEIPWFAAEMIYFRRILEASGFFQPGPSAAIDPYRVQKLSANRAMIAPLSAALAAIEAGGVGEAGLRRLLRSAIWGNQADLSMWPAGGETPAAPSEDLHTAHLLADDADAAASWLLERGASAGRVDFVLDNGGLELGFDLLLADFLFSHGLVETIYYHAKPYPTYVSDVTIPEIGETLEFLDQHGDAGLRRLSARLKNRLASGSLRPATHFFWISPLAGWEMPPDLKSDLAGSGLIISKGDANYRRWLGDRHWPFTTSFQAITAYRPAPLLALRVLKSEVVAGLAPGRQAELDRLDPQWMYNGKWGVIQFTP